MDKGLVVDDIGEGMQCSNHPYKNNPGGICAFCLQEKLGKLLSSSSSSSSHQSSPCSFFPSSSSPSFRSDSNNKVGSVKTYGSLGFTTTGGATSSMIPSSKKKMKKVVGSSTDVHSNSSNLALKRSKSSSSGAVAIIHHPHLFDGEEYSPRKNGFWSFLHFSSRRSSRDKMKGESRPSVHPTTTNNHAIAKDKCVGESSSSMRRGEYGDENESPNSSHASSSSFGRKVARSRSVGCGSRSFSGDLLERISTGFGDCTLRRVESQREAKQASKGMGMRGRGMGMGMGMGEHHHIIKERVKCGGIFGGFSSSSSSSSYWASSSEEVNNDNRRGLGIGNHITSLPPHSRSKSWGWAFASPMRAFRSTMKPEDKNSAATHNANATTPNLSAIPSLLTVL
ncbi:hypothetical protein IFM89_031317 [Coptis chinensis]|uniref:Vitellogenin-like protein n=1 Tax=Coptis chinensis TaxID=261450 RepID=A0A835IYM4_9MAGN|nr:hypothetical protein IFM89_031317 [Coptis chinensis]